MILKPSAIALCTSCSIPSPLAFPSSITSSCNPSHAARRPRRHAYATVSHDAFDRHCGHDDADFSACRWPSSEEPSPYEIFDQERGAPYSKARFYQLVKVYHPDRYRHLRHGHHAGLTHAAKLERYRLVVAANDILCDPAKRRAYDLYGAGWGDASDMHNSYREADRSWRRRPGNASQNATWEDWERWRREQKGEKQEPVYMSNGSFVAVMLFLIMVGSFGQATRAGVHSVTLLEMRDKKHAAASREMHQRLAGSAQLTREARVESFLRQREGWRHLEATGGHMPDEHGQKPARR